MMTVEFKSDDGRRVYRLSVDLTIKATLYILARDEAQAERLAKATNLEDYFTFDQDSLTTDGERLLKIDDVVATDIVDLSSLTMESTYDYPPNEHPDFVGVKER